MSAHPTFTDSMRWWLLMLLECPACFGFWTGLAHGLFVQHSRALEALQLGLLTCTSNLLLGKWAGLIATDEGGNSASATGK